MRDQNSRGFGQVIVVIGAHKGFVLAVADGESFRFMGVGWGGEGQVSLRRAWRRDVGFLRPNYPRHT